MISIITAIVTSAASAVAARNPGARKPEIEEKTKSDWPFYAVLGIECLVVAAPVGALMFLIFRLAGVL